MDSKILLAFAGGAVLASGIVYMAVRPDPAPKALAATSAQPASRPDPVVAETPAAPDTSPAWPAARGVQAERPERPAAARVREPSSKPRLVTQAKLDRPAIAPSVPVAQPAPAAPAQPEAPAASAPPPPREDTIPPPPPPTPHSVTITAGTMLSVRLGETITTQKNQSGDSFMATLAQPLVVDGLVVAERGARVEGRIVELERAGKVKGLSKVVLELTKLTTSDGQHIRIRTASFNKQGDPSLKKDAVKVGIGAALGAAIGAIAGGGKGAAIGTGVGGAAGAGDVMMTRGNDAVIPVETKLTFRMEEPVTITERLR